MTKAKILHRGPWQIPYKAINVLCSDGKRRNARTAMDADTFFTLPASVQVKGKTVTGHIYSVNDDLHFAAYTYRRNANMLPEWGS